MRLSARFAIALSGTVAATSCSSPPGPTARPTPAPTALSCPTQGPQDPGYVSSARNLVVNGSFGMPSITGNRSVAALPGWAVHGPVTLVSSPSCLRFPDNQYLSMAFGASISQQVATVKGTKYLIQSSDSMEGVCTTAGTALNMYWNSTLLSTTTTLAAGTTPEPEANAWGGYSTGGGTVTGTGAPGLLRFVAANAAHTCGLDLSNVSMQVAPH